MGEEERNLLVLAHLALVKPAARALSRTLPHHAKIDLEDLIQAGSIGLIDAATRFDPGKGVQFGTFARHKIRGAMLDSLRGIDWASRGTRRGINQLRLAQKELWSKLGRKPDSEELARKMGATVEQMGKLLLVASGGEVSIDISRHFLSDPVQLIDDDICRRQMIELFRNAVNRLKKRDARIMNLYYLRDVNMRQIAKLVGLTEGRISQIIRRNLRKIIEELPVAGYRTE